MKAATSIRLRIRALSTAHALRIRRLAVVCTLTGCLFQPFTVGERSVTPEDFQSWLGAGDTGPHPILAADGHATFKIAIAPDPAESDGPVSMAELEAMSSAGASDRFAQSMIQNPHRYTRSLTLEATSTTGQGDCELRLELVPAVATGSLRSRAARCPTAGRPPKVAFQFDQPLMPGIYGAVVRAEPTALDGGIQVAGSRGASGETWLAVTASKQRKTAFDGLSLLARKYPGHAALYLTCLALVTWLAWARSTQAWSGLLLLLAATYVSNLTIARHFSGHDETAHIEMFHSSILDSAGIPEGPARASRRVAMYQDARRLMLDEDFFRLHGAKVPAKGTCPHMIIGDCGISGSPQNLYGFYARNLVPIDPDNAGARSIALAGRTINAALTLLALAMVMAWFGRGAAGPTAFLLLSGGYLAQVATVTNDYPLMMLGVFGSACMMEIIPGRTRRSVAGMLAFAIMLFALRKVDRSWVSGLLPLLAGVPALGVSFLVSSTRKKSSGFRKDDSIRHPARGARGAVVDTLTAAIFVVPAAVLTAVGVWQAPSLWAAGHQSFLQAIVNLSPDGHMILKAKPFAPGMTLDILRFHFSSFIGTFIWGHSYFAPSVYAIFLAAWGYLTMRGLREAGKSGPMMCAATLIPLGAGLGCYFVMVMLLASYNEIVPGADLDAAVKFRFMAAGVGVVTALPLTGLKSLLADRRKAHGAVIASAFWAAILLAYYQLKFYYSDTF